MSQTLRYTATVGPDHQLTIRDPRLEPGSTAELVITIEPRQAGTGQDDTPPIRNDWLWSLVERARGTRSGAEIQRQIDSDRDEWDRR